MINNKIIGIGVAGVVLIVAVFLVKTQGVSQVRQMGNEYVVDASDMYALENSNSDNVDFKLTEQEKTWLIVMREEEKLAHDVYTTLGNKWGSNIFSNIAASEQTHTDTIKMLLNRYAIQDPSTDTTVGVFTSVTMQKLYTDLVAKGSVSKSDALIVGATIEDLDIHDLDTALAETSKQDIILAYKNLQKGSRNHMRAFVKNIQVTGGSYRPQYISDELYKDIISSSQERGRMK